MNRTVGLFVLMTMGMFLFAATLCAQAAKKETRTIVFAGSGSGVAIVRVLAKEFERRNPGIRVEVPPSIGTGGGIKAAAAGSISAGMATRPLKPEEKALGLSHLPFAATAQALAVHPSVPEDGITTAELIAIYRGKKTQWRNGRKIVVLTREPGDSSMDIIRNALPGFSEAYLESIEKRYWYVLYSDQIMNQTLASTRDAIGLTDLGEVAAERLPVKPLRLNGVAPTLDNVKKGTYPLVKNLAFVYRDDLLSPDARRFIDFVKSKEGARILLRTNYLPR